MSLVSTRMSLLLGIFLMFHCAGGFLYADTVLVGSDYTSNGVVDGDLVVVDGSIKVTTAGGLIVNGDVKVASGNVFMGPSGGTLRVFGDLIVSNTLPSGDASIITHNALEVSGAIVTRSEHGQAIITTTGGGTNGTLDAERIITKGYGNSSVYTGSDILVVSEIDTKSTTSHAFVVSDGGNLYAGRIQTNAAYDGHVYAEDIFVLGKLMTCGADGSARVEAGTYDICSNSITTSGGLGAYVKASRGIDVLGDIKTTSTGDDAYVLANTSSMTAGSIVTNAYNDGYVDASTRLIVNGNISTKASTGDGYVDCGTGEIFAVNILTDASGYGHLVTTSHVTVRRSIYTEGNRAYIKSGGEVSAYRITTFSDLTEGSVEATGDIVVGGVIETNCPSLSYIRTVGGDIFAESIFTNDGNARIDSGETILVKDIIKAKSGGGAAYVKAAGDISARSISTDANAAGYIESTGGSVKVVGDVRTQSSTGSAHVYAADDVFARSIHTITPAGTDDVVTSGPGSGRFKLFVKPTDTRPTLTVTHSEFFIDSDCAWDTVLSVVGSCTFDGNGHQLLFGSGGGISVSPGARLFMKNIDLENVGWNAVRCVDNTATLSLMNVSWTQTSDTIFENGKLHISGDVVVYGQGTEFLFDAGSTSTIHVNSTFMFSHDVTLSYNANAEQGIWLPEDSSRIMFDGATLFANTDIRFTNGVLSLDNAVTFSIAAGKKCYFGNGIAAGNLSVDPAQGSEFIVYGDLDEEIG